MKQSQPETILAELVVNWLESQKWDVYQEVQIETYGRVADIVAVLGNLVWVIECKKSLSLSVMEQAYRWRRYSNFISVAVQRRKGTDSRLFATKVLRTFNVGMLTIDLGCPSANKISEIVRPALNRKGLTARIKEKLSPIHKTFAKAGNSDGLRWTPFQQTSISIRREVEKCPGITMTELMNKIHHHYSTESTARSCISQWAQNGVLKGVCVKRDGRLIRLYPTGDKNN